MVTTVGDYGDDRRRLRSRLLETMAMIVGNSGDDCQRLWSRQSETLIRCSGMQSSAGFIPPFSGVCPVVGTNFVSLRAKAPVTAAQQAARLAANCSLSETK